MEWLLLKGLHVKILSHISTLLLMSWMFCLGKNYGFYIHSLNAFCFLLPLTVFFLIVIKAVYFHNCTHNLHSFCPLPFKSASVHLRYELKRMISKVSSLPHLVFLTSFPQTFEINWNMTIKVLRHLNIHRHFSSFLLNVCNFFNILKDIVLICSISYAYCSPACIRSRRVVQSSLFVEK